MWPSVLYKKIIAKNNIVITMPLTIEQGDYMAVFKIGDSVKIRGGQTGKVVEIVGQRARPMSNVKGKMEAENRPGKSYVVRLNTGKRGRPTDIWPENDDLTLMGG